MKDKLIHFLHTYGNDFFYKIHKYKTARYNGRFVKLVSVNENDWTVVCEIDNSYQTVDLFDLDEFCL